jgi:3D-(3,5/4)-trihydroxycyclohexane-1,2-dione acylhydrolase (decyclizing)
MATPEAEVIVMVGDGSYLMMNSDIYSSVLTGHKLIVVVCDNGGFAVIDRLQTYKGVPSFNNLLRDCRVKEMARVDFARHAEAMGAIGEHVRSLAELEQALARAKRAERTSVIVVDTDPGDWTPGDAWWDVGVPAASARESVRKAAADHAAGKRRQRLGV